MWNSIGSWFCIMGLIVGPFAVGIAFEDKLQRANRELGSRLLRRYYTGFSCSYRQILS